MDRGKDRPVLAASSWRQCLLVDLQKATCWVLQAQASVATRARAGSAHGGGRCAVTSGVRPRAPWPRPPRLRLLAGARLSRATRRGEARKDTWHSGRLGLNTPDAVKRMTLERGNRTRNGANCLQSHSDGDAEQQTGNRSVLTQAVASAGAPNTAEVRVNRKPGPGWTRAPAAVTREASFPVSSALGTELL